jgi:hypothetical protein
MSFNIKIHIPIPIYCNALLQDSSDEWVVKGADNSEGDNKMDDEEIKKAATQVRNDFMNSFLNMKQYCLI